MAEPHVPDRRVMVLGACDRTRSAFIDAMTRSWESLGRRVPGAFHAYLDPSSHEAVRAFRVGLNGGEEPALEPRGITARLVAPAPIGDRLWRFDMPTLCDFPKSVEPDTVLSGVWITVAQRDLGGLELKSLVDHAITLMKGCCEGVMLVVDASGEASSNLLDGFDDPFRGLVDEPGPLSTVNEKTIAAIPDRLASHSADISRDDWGGGGRVLVCPVVLPSRNVLTPLVWTAARPGKPDTADILIVLDELAAASLGHGWEDRIRSEVPASARITVYHLGSREPVTHRKTSSASRGMRPQLFGPILDAAPCGAIVVAIVGVSLLDIEDFHGTDWDGRLQVIDLDESAEEGEILSEIEAFFRAAVSRPLARL